jgi:hypothetical protein
MDKPIYLAILGDVFDVTAGASFYAKPDGGYSFFSGVDASRSYSTGCFETHLTHDIRGLSEKQVKVRSCLFSPSKPIDPRLPRNKQAIKDWRDFYLKSKKYFKVGTVLNPPIDPDSPIPPDCNEPKK